MTHMCVLRFGHSLGRPSRCLIRPGCKAVSSPFFWDPYSCTVSAMNVHTQMLELRAKDRVEATTLDHIIGTYLAQFVKDVAQETLRAGLLAKKRAEDEVTTALGLRLQYLLRDYG